jgi:hypothetical protein
MEEKTKQNLKIAAVILLLGPLIFVGTCFPLGFIITPAFLVIAPFVVNITTCILLLYFRYKHRSLKLRITGTVIGVLLTPFIMLIILIAVAIAPLCGLVGIIAQICSNKEKTEKIHSITQKPHEINITSL